MVYEKNRLSRVSVGIGMAVGKSLRGAFALAVLGLALASSASAHSGVELKSISLDPQMVMGGASSTGTATLSEEAPTGGTTVTLASDNAAATVPASVTVAAGSTSATFTVATTTVGKRTLATISGTVGSHTRRAVLELETLLVQSVAITPASVTGGASASGVVTLNAAAPSAGAVVTLSSSSSSATIPATVTVSGGAASATFSIATTTVASQTVVRIKASLGNNSQIGGLLLEPTTSFAIALNSATVGGGSITGGTITLTSAAPAGGLGVLLTSNNSAVHVEPSVRIPAGRTTAKFGILTSGVAASTPVTITASIGGVSETATLTVTPPSLSGVSLNPAAVAASESTTGHVTISGFAPSGGIVVTLSSSSADATVPASVTVEAGRSGADFKVTTAAVTSAETVTITATYSGVSETATLAISPLGLESVMVRPNSVDGGHSSTGTVELTGPAGSGGVVVTLTSSDTSTTVPATVTIKAGRKTADFPITTTAVLLQTSVTIRATVGPVSQVATLTVNPVSLEGLELRPSRVAGGGTSTGTIRISGPAPAGGIVITLASNSTSATVPATVTIPAGQNSVAFTITTAKVTSKTIVQISASLGAMSQTQNLTITTSA